MAASTVQSCMLPTRAGPLEYTLSGRGSPAIVLLNGAGMTLDAWSALYPAIERLGRVFAWNRRGVEGSADPVAAQDGAAVLASLRELLGRTGLAPPYVLVGHSLGGLFANLFARSYPAEVAAVLFLEATHPGDDAVLQQDEAQLRRGLSRMLDEPASAFAANLHAELEAAGDTVRQVAEAGRFPPVPLAVITGGMDPPGSLLAPAAARARRLRQAQLARLSPHGEQVIARRSGHFPQRSEPGLVLQVLARLVARARRAG